MAPMIRTPNETSRNSFSKEQQPAQKGGALSFSEDQTKWDIRLFPKPLCPLGMVPWEQTKVPLLRAGWTRYHDETTSAFRYQPYVGGPDLSEAEIQRVAQEWFGWEPPH